MIVFPDNRLVRGARDIVRRLREHGYQAFFVGGAVRDCLLGLPVKDIDIATDARPERVQQLFPRTYGVGMAFGIVVVVQEGGNYEVAAFREERDYCDGRHPETVCYAASPQPDAARRDFTVNAMFADPFTGEILDFFDGQGDLRRGLLRTVGDPDTRFREDYLRLLRAVRFAVRFRFDLAADLTTAVKRYAGRAARLSPERIREELNAMLTGPDPAAALVLLRELELLPAVLPEVAATAGVTQPPEYHPEGDVFAHTVLMLRHMAIPSVELAWSILLHDIGKVPARTM
ncbi:MAG: CCA tRNA nucleotidyltransferase, partial [Victivallales bacterium]|nr:CCA tRNA nucleotidyltransferase [Victivallales bacterium]